ncbi:hypothetical protein KQI08_11355 [Paraeggerthella hongkongensis]|uniref:hypothetical protein n=1 Tax=Eggerthellaceae TaxID=1643826 RepID=UPI001C0FA2AE|nr:MULTISPECIES: hypothetical protein [Eggerthellaceae]MBU5406495.1 hypothetical protein [Paraeggerthella hongkongensis]MCD2434261.1 hypothetical protein [Paraeggerthella hominis]
MTNKTKVLLALAVGAMLILVASTVVRCTLVHQIPPQEQADSAAIEEGAANQSDQSTQEQELPAGEADSLEVLKGNAWTAENGQTSITFKDGRYVESDGTAVKLSTFDINSVSKQGKQTTIMLKLDQENGTVKDSMILLRQSDDGSYVVTSDDFQLAKSYSQGSINVQPLEIVGINDEFRELLGGNTDGIQAAISDYAHTCAPTAHKATWANTLVVDYAQHIVTANFTCDDAAATVLTVEYARGPATFTVVG